jgi:hypothetical protein
MAREAVHRVAAPTNRGIAVSAHRQSVLDDGEREGRERNRIVLLGIVADAICWNEQVGQAEIEPDILAPAIGDFARASAEQNCQSQHARFRRRLRCRIALSKSALSKQIVDGVRGGVRGRCLRAHVGARWTEGG